MVHTSALTAAAAALLLALPCSAGLYSKNSPVLQVDGKNYDRLIAMSNHTSLVEFYAPWCGHCQKLQPVFEKAAKNLAGLVKLAAIDCDEDENKPFCGGMGVQGYPTLKIVKPGKKPGKPIVEDYNGGRDAKSIVDTMIGKIPNHVKKVTDNDLGTFLSEGNATAKAILFTDKGTTSALLKAVAIDFLGSITVAQIRSKEAAAVETFGIAQFPSIVLLPGGEAPAILYDGEIKKDSIVGFFAQAAAPNPDPAPAKVKMPKKKKEAKPTAKSSESASSSYQASQAPEGTASTTAETTEEAPQPTESHEPEEATEGAPIVRSEAVPAIPSFATSEELVETCLSEKSGTCILAFTPKVHNEAATKALDSLAEIAHKHRQANRKIFPFHAVPDESNMLSDLLKSFGWAGDVEIFAMNRKRGWYMIYGNKDLSVEAVETWIDQIRMGEGVKQKLPGAIIPDNIFREAAAAAVQSLEDRTEEPEASETAVVVEEIVTPEELAEHDEL